MIDIDDIQRAFATGYLARMRALGKIAGQRYRRSQITQMAAAMSFRTIFGIIPMLAVGLVVLHSFVNEAQMRRVVSTVLDYSGLASITIETGGRAAQPLLTDDLFLFGPPSPAHQEATAQAVEAEQKAAASHKERLDEWITRVLDQVGSVNFGAVGIVGLVLLIYAAMSIIVEAEKSFNQIIEAPLGKNWVRRVRDYWALLTLGPLLLVMSFGVRQGANELAQAWTRRAEAKEVVQAGDFMKPTPAVAPAVASVAETPPADTASAEPTSGDGAAADAGADAEPTIKPPEVETGWRGALVGFVGFATTVVITTLALLIVYTSVPNASVQIVAASAGAGFAAILWEASKWAFTSYIEYSTAYAQLYGVLALLPLFLLWVYVTWIIVLLGFQVTAILQGYRKISREGFKRSVLIALGIVDDPDEARRTGLCLVDPASVLVVMAGVTDHFVRGLPASSREIADETGLEASVVTDLLQRLVEIALLHRVSVIKTPAKGALSVIPVEADGPARYTLARPPESISAIEVLRVGDSFTGRDTSRPAPILDAISQAKHRALEGKSLADIHAMLIRLPVAEAPALA